MFTEFCQHCEKSHMITRSLCIFHEMPSKVEICCQKWNENEKVGELQSSLKKDPPSHSSRTCAKENSPDRAEPAR